MIIAVNKATGEVVELPSETPQDIVNAWKVAQEYVKTAKALKDQLKKLVPDMVGDKGLSETVDGYQFRVSNIQRKTYDKAVMRQVFDEDTLDLFLKPDKPTIDKYIKEHLEELGDGSTRLREAMVDEGSPYQVIKLERLDR